MGGSDSPKPGTDNGPNTALAGTVLAPSGVPGFPGAATETQAAAISRLKSSPVYTALSAIRGLNLEASKDGSVPMPTGPGTFATSIMDGHLEFIAPLLEKLEDPGQISSGGPEFFSSFLSNPISGDRFSILDIRDKVIPAYIKRLLSEADDVKKNGPIAKDLEKIKDHGGEFSFNFNTFVADLRASEPKLYQRLQGLLSLDEATTAGSPIGKLQGAPSAPDSARSTAEISKITGRYTKFTKFLESFSKTELGLDEVDFSSYTEAALIGEFQSETYPLQAFIKLWERREEPKISTFLKNVPPEKIDRLVAIIIFKVITTKVCPEETCKVVILQYITDDFFNFTRIMGNPILIGSPSASHFINGVLTERKTSIPPAPSIPAQSPSVPSAPPVPGSAARRDTMRGIPAAPPITHAPPPVSKRTGPPPLPEAARRSRTTLTAVQPGVPLPPPRHSIASAVPAPQSARKPSPLPPPPPLPPGGLPPVPPLPTNAAAATAGVEHEIEVDVGDLEVLGPAGAATILATSIGGVPAGAPASPLAVQAQAPAPVVPPAFATTPITPGKLHFSSGELGVTTYPPAGSFYLDLSNPKQYEVVAGQPTTRLNFVDLLSPDGSITVRYPVPYGIGEISIGGAPSDTICIEGLRPGQFVLSFQNGIQPSIQSGQGSIMVAVDGRAPETLIQGNGKNFGAKLTITAQLQTDNHLYHRFNVSTNQNVSTAAIAPNLLYLLYETVTAESRIVNEREDEIGSPEYIALTNRYAALLQILKDKNIAVDDDIARLHNRLYAKADAVIAERKKKVEAGISASTARYDAAHASEFARREEEAVRALAAARMTEMPTIADMLHDKIVAEVAQKFPKGYFTLPNEKFNQGTDIEDLVDYTGPVLLVSSASPISGGFQIPGTNQYIVPLILPEELIGSNKKVCTIDVPSQGAQNIFAKITFDEATGQYQIYNVSGKLNHEGTRVHHVLVEMQPDQSYNVGMTAFKLYKEGVGLSKAATADSYDKRAQEVFDRVFDMSGTDASQDRADFAWIMAMIRNGKVDQTKWLEKINNALRDAMTKIELGEDHKEDAHLFETILTIIDDSMMEAHLAKDLRDDLANPNHKNIRRRLKEAAEKDIAFYNTSYQKVADADNPESINFMGKLAARWKKPDPAVLEKQAIEVEQARTLIRQGKVQIARFLEMELLSHDDFRGHDGIKINHEFLEEIHRIKRVRILLDKLATGNFGHSDDDKIEDVLGPLVSQTRGQKVRDILSPEEIEVLKQDEYFMGLISSQQTALQLGEHDATYLISRLCNRAGKAAFDDANSGKNTSDEQDTDIRTVYYIMEHFPVTGRHDRNRFNFTALLPGEDPVKAEEMVRLNLARLRHENEQRKERERHETQQRLAALEMARNVGPSAEVMQEESDRGVLVLVTGDIAQVRNSTALAAAAAIPELLSLHGSFLNNPMRDEVAGRRMEPGAWDAAKASYVTTLKGRFAEAAKLTVGAHDQAEFLERLLAYGLHAGHVTEAEIGVTKEARAAGVIRSKFNAFKAKASKPAESPDQEFAFVDDAAAIYKSLQNDNEKEIFAGIAYEILGQKFAGLVAEFNRAGTFKKVAEQVDAYSKVDRRARALNALGILTQKTSIQSADEFRYDLLDLPSFTAKLSQATL